MSLRELEYMHTHTLDIVTVLFWSALQCEKEVEQIIARTHLVMYLGTFRVERIFFNDAISSYFRAQKFPLIFLY